MRDLEAFLAALPAMGVKPEQINVYKTHLSWSAAHLTKMGRAELIESEIPVLLEMARKEGAGDARMRNLETACITYARWRGRQGARPRPAPRPTIPQPKLPEKRSVPTAAVAGLILGVLLMLGLIAFRPSRDAEEPKTTPSPVQAQDTGEAISPRGVAEPAPAPAGSASPPPSGNDCAVLRRCCDGKANSMFCAVAFKGNASQCRQAISTMKETGIVDCWAKSK